MGKDSVRNGKQSCFQISGIRLIKKHTTQHKYLLKFVSSMEIHILKTAKAYLNTFSADSLIQNYSMLEYLMKQQKDLLMKYKPSKERKRKNRIVHFVPQDTTQTSKEFGLLVIWMPIMQLRGVKVEKLIYKTVRCYARHTIVRKEIDNKEFKEMEADHIKPQYQGGKTTGDNYQILCKICNRTKSGK